MTETGITELIMNITDLRELTANVVTIPAEKYRIVQGVFMIVASYVTLNLMLFHLRPYVIATKCCQRRRATLQRKRGSNDHHTSSSSAGSNGASWVKPQQQTDQYYQCAQGTMTFLALSMNLLVLVHIAMDLWAYSKRNVTSGHAQCVRHVVSGTTYFVSCFCLYAFLWMRQRSFYSHPVLKHLAKPCLVRFSWSVLGMICLSFVAVSVLFFLPQMTQLHRKQEYLYNLTLLDDKKEIVINYADLGLVPPQCAFIRKNIYVLVHFLLTLTFLYFQVSLQILFAYPIYSQHQNRARFLKQSNRSDHPNGDNGRVSAQKMRTWIKKDPTTTISRESSIPRNSLKEEFSTAEYATSCHCDVTEMTGWSSKAPNAESEISQDVDAAADPKSDKRRSVVKQNLESGIIRTVIEENEHAVELGGKKEHEKCRLTERNRAVRHREKGRGLGRQQSRATGRLQRYVIRCLTVSIVCSVSDIFAFLVSYFVQPATENDLGIPVPVIENYLSSLTYNANMLINLYCVLICYNDWKQRLFPWWFFLKKDLTGR